jgi:TPR repeat protein
VAVALAALTFVIAAAGRPARNKADPVRALRRACDSGDARACAELARRYRAGDGVPRDMARFVEALLHGCEAGEPALCVEGGRAVLRGEGVKPDPQLAKELFGDACTERASAGCRDLALMLQNGSGVPQDTKGAAVLFDKACVAGDANACQLLGDSRWTSPEQDAKGAQASYQRACALDHPSGCTKLADLLRLEAPGSAKAIDLYKKACAADEKDACTALALDKPCEGREACLDLSLLCSDYLAGYDVLAEPRLALSPCEKACAGGVGEACDNLADMYQDGSGVTRDEEHATALRKRACELGDEDACQVRQ